MYKVNISGLPLLTHCKTLKEAKAEVMRLMSKIPQQRQNIYIDQHKNGKATGLWYRYNYDTDEWVKSQ